MEFNEIATVSGKGGLFKVLKPSKTGVILESLDEDKARFMAGPTARVSILNDISIYTTSEEGSVSLEEVFKKIYKEFKEDIGIDPNEDGEELKAFLKHILPDYDEERVYVSDIKKLVKWYGVLLQNAPELLKEAKKEEKKSSGKAGDDKKKTTKAETKAKTGGPKKRSASGNKKSS